MSEAPIAPAAARTDPATARTSTDWTLRPFLATSRSPLWVGLAITVGYVTINESLQWLAPALGFCPGGSALPPSVALWSTLVAGTLMGLLPTANVYLHRGVRRDLCELRRCLHHSDDEFERLVHEVASPSPTLLRWGGLCGLLAGGLNALFDPVLREFHRDLAVFDPRYVWFIAQNAVQIFLGARLIVTEMHMTRAYARLGERLVTVDLLDVGPLAAFGRKGQRSVVLWVLLSSVMSLFWVVESAGSSNAALAALLLLLITAAFLLPASGLRRNIRAAKADELARVRERLRLERVKLLDPAHGGAGDASKMAELISYRELIADVHEWPFDVPALLRFLLFAGLGAGSWLGGALVERGVDTLLG